MKPIANNVLLVLLLVFCGLCAWQWQRESKLREVMVAKMLDFNVLKSEHDELTARVKAADGEILRLNGTLSELKATSVSKDEQESLNAANTEMKAGIEKQNLALKEQAEALMKANEAILQANDSIKKLTTERDELVKKLNKVTSQYNELARRK